MSGEKLNIKKNFNIRKIAAFDIKYTLQNFYVKKHAKVLAAKFLI
jgi:hypothetical protein